MRYLALLLLIGCNTEIQRFRECCEKVKIPSEWEASCVETHPQVYEREVMGVYVGPGSYEQCRTLYCHEFTTCEKEQS